MIISYNQIVQMFSDFAEAHLQLNDFGIGPTSEIGTSKKMNFPYLWLTHRSPSNIMVSNKTQIPELRLTFIIVDQLNNQVNLADINGSNSTNEQEVLSDCFQIAQDLVNYISTQMGQFGVMLMDEAISIEPVYDETPDVASGWVMDLALKLKHSNCITPLGEITFTVPGTSNISLRYLTCDTLNNCASFNEAIDNLQEQIDNIQTTGYIYTSTLTQPLTNNTDTPINAYSFNIEAGGIYKVTLIGQYQVSPGFPNGFSIFFNGNTNNIINGYLNTVQNESASPDTAKLTTISFFGDGYTTVTNAPNTPASINGEMIIICNTDSTVTVDIASESNGPVAQLNAGSTLLVEKIN